MSHKHPRLTSLDQSPIEMIITFSEGNPGAARVLSEAWKNAESIDPDSALGPLGPLAHLDALDCYGSRIWMLYKDVCGSDIATFIGALRCTQMGILRHTDLNAAIDGAAIDLNAAIANLKERLPRFATPEGADRG